MNADCTLVRPRAGRRTRLGGWLIVGLVALGGLTPALAANIAGPRRSALDRLEETDAVRQRLLLRGGRFEITPTVGFTLNDPFQRNLLFGANLGYHFTDSFAFGATILTATSFETGLAEEVQQKRAERVDGFSGVTLLGSAELVYTPLFGKFALFGRAIVNYDLHLIVGGGLALTGAVGDVDSEDLGGGTPLLLVGLGFRSFVNDWFSINIEVRDYIYSYAINSVAGADINGDAIAESEWSNNFAVTVGFGFFFPQEPQLSE